MKRFDAQELKILKKLIRGGFSLNKMAEILGRSKSSIYYWYKKLKGKKIKDVEINYDLLEDIGEIVGAFAGDGNYYCDSSYHHKIRIYLSPDEEKYATRLKEKMKKVFRKSPRVYRYPHIIIIEIISKKVLNFLRKYLRWKEGNKTHTIALKISPYNLPRKFLKGFCRGLFDTDGWVVKNNLMISCVSDSLMENLSCSLTILSIKHKFSEWKRKGERPVKAIILDKKSTSRYFKIIGTSNPKRKVLPRGLSG